MLWLVLVALCAAVFAFLHQFTVSDAPMRYIEWETSARVLADGTEEAFDIAGYAPPEEPNGSVYRFTATLAGDLGDGYLLFETSGLDLALMLDNAEIYRSGFVTGGDMARMAQAYLPLPPDAAGKKLTALCSPLGGAGMFPPLLRYTSDSAVEKDAMAYANLRGIPSGAFGLALVLICGLFLLGFAWKKPDWSLVPLMVAALGMLAQPIATTIGYSFLPQGLFNILTWRGFYLVILAAFLVFFFMNRRRDFWRLLGLAALASGGALAVCYLISLWRGSYLAAYVNSELAGLFGHGIYTGIAFWLTFWMVMVCAAISAYALLRTFAKTRADAQANALREQLAMDSYRHMETKLRETAALRHETRHQLTSLDALYKSGDMRALGAELARLTALHTAETPMIYTENLAINTILQSAAAQAKAAGVCFEAAVHTPASLPIPESDLCGFLMNMLDNALEAASAVDDPKQRVIRVRIELSGHFLALRCENACKGELRRDGNGFPQTTKPEPEWHGFGLERMRDIAVKYGSLLDISFTGDTFTVQTALCLPGR